MCDWSSVMFFQGFSVDGCTKLNTILCLTDKLTLIKSNENIVIFLAVSVTTAYKIICCLSGVDIGISQFK